MLIVIIMMIRMIMWILTAVILMIRMIYNVNFDCSHHDDKNDHVNFDCSHPDDKNDHVHILTEIILMVRMMVCFLRSPFFFAV